jgi:hypothetical protein
MADFGMYGPAQSGARLAEQDSISNFLKIAQGTHETALAQEAQQRANEKQQEAIAFSKLTTPDGQAGPGAGGSMADIGDWQAKELIRLQQPQAAMRMGLQAAKIRLEEAHVGQVQAAQRNQEIAGQIKSAEGFARLYSGVRDKESWDAANLMAAQMFPGDPHLQEVIGRPYNPAYVERIRGLALSEKDRLHAQQEALRTSIQASNAGSLNAVRQARMSLIESQKKYLGARTDAAIKNGGSTGRGVAAGSPNKDQQKDARQVLDAQYPGLPPAELDLAGVQVASEAKALMAATRGMDWNTALNRASANAAKDMSVVSKLWGADTRTFRNGATPAVAIPFTRGMKIEPGKHYTANGRVAVGTADGKLRVTDAPTSGQSAAPADDGEEDQ